MSRQPIFNAKPAILFTAMTAFVVGLNWALWRLADSLGFWPFMAFGAVALPLMISCGFAWDHFEKHRNSRESQQ
jgi:hypothetical protein